jgi:hypothetical protein
MIQKTLAIATLAVLGPASLLADFQYQETTKITGGMMSGMMKFAGAFNKQVNEPVVSTTIVKGNRMAHISPHHGSIIDLDSETITSIDFDKRTYTVMTFQQMKEQMQKAMEQAQAQNKGQRDQKVDDRADLNFKASVKDTGQKRDISGVNTREFVLNLMMEGTDKQTGDSGGLAMSNDMWMAPEIRGYQEIRDFHRRMAEKMGSIIGEGFNPMMLGRPDMAKGMAEMAKEMSKLKGIPVLQIMRMGTSVNGQPLPSASEAPDAAKVNGPDMKGAAGNAAAGTAASAAESRLGRLGGLAGGLGGLGGLSRKKKQEQAPPPDTQTGPAILMEMTTESTGFSSGPVDVSKFEVPAGFKQVDPAAGRRGR